MTPSMVVLPVQHFVQRPRVLDACCHGCRRLAVPLGSLLVTLGSAARTRTSWPLGRSAVWACSSQLRMKKRRQHKLLMNCFALPDGRGTILCCYTKPLAETQFSATNCLVKLTFRCVGRNLCSSRPKLPRTPWPSIQNINACHLSRCIP